MTIRSRFTAGGMAAALALGGVTAAAAGTTWAGAAQTGTGAATATDDAASTAGGSAAPDPSLAARITGALSGLVADGTITQDQASAVATALASSDALRGPGGGHGHGPGMGWGAPGGLDVAARTLGISEEELRTALRDGSTLAQVAKENGVAEDTLVDALVAAGQERLTAAVADGRLTQEQADELSAALRERVVAMVQEPWQPPGPGLRGDRHLGGHMGGGMGGLRNGTDAGDASSTPDV